MKRLLLISFVFLMPLDSIAQNFSVNLSPRHLQKLETYKSGHKRLVHYYKFYKRDSTRQSRKLEKHYKHVLDSAYRADRKQEKLRRAMENEMQRV